MDVHWFEVATSLSFDASSRASRTQPTSWPSSSWVEGECYTVLGRCRSWAAFLARITSDIPTPTLSFRLPLLPRFSVQRAPWLPLDPNNLGISFTVKSPRSDNARPRRFEYSFDRLFYAPTNERLCPEEGVQQAEARGSKMLLI